MSQEKVLIVEDEENERTGLAELVSPGAIALKLPPMAPKDTEKVTNWLPSIVITDLKMPRMGGIELLEKIASEQARPWR